MSRDPRRTVRRPSTRTLRTAGVLALVLLLGPAVVPSSPGLQAAAPPLPTEALPTGFTDAAVASVPSPVAVRAMPDGSVVVLGKTGTVHVIRGGWLVPTPALTLPDVCSNSERGLLGVAADANFTSNGFVYLYYTHQAGTCVNRVSRFTMSGNTIDPGSEVVLLDNIASTGANHNGGDVEIGKDGYLYVSVGDAGSDPRGGSPNDAAQDLSLLNGKILRVDPATGEGAPGNPLNAAGVRFFINDVGQSTREEVDDGILGANYGWPTREGVCPQGQNPPCAAAPGGVTDPLTDYPRSVGQYVTGGAFVPNGHWPAFYDGAYIFGDGGSGDFWVHTAAGAVDYAQPFHTADGVSDMAFVLESTGLSLYYVVSTTSTNSVRKITYATQDVPTPTNPLHFVPSTAQRVLDTRTPADGAAPLVGNTPRLVDAKVDGAVTRAVLANLTYVAPEADGFLTAWAADAPRPATSNINALHGEVVANSAVIPVDANGRIQILSNTPAHVVIDILGRFELAPGPVADGRFVPLTPDRAIDTREPSAPGTNPYTETGGAPINVVSTVMSGQHGVPATGVGAVVLTVTALAGSMGSGGWVTAVPGGAPLPLASNVNTNGLGDIRPNLVVVPLGAGGSIDLHLFQTNDVVVDVTGYFTDATATPSTAGRFRSISPYREADTRTPFGFERFSGLGSRSLDPVVVPGSAIGIAHNLVIVGNETAGFITAYPADPVPGSSTANADGRQQLRAASAFTAMGPGGTVRYFSNMTTDLVVDVTGWFEG
ncbi:MAG: PQQ-dependent sugar dehydrogenase [Actinobacteria bacterium]|nr:PQQ-dependent sugar dehydrogenase [Actinomycetota bacterium]